MPWGTSAACTGRGAVRFALGTVCPAFAIWCALSIGVEWLRARFAAACCAALTRSIRAGCTPLSSRGHCSPGRSRLRRGGLFSLLPIADQTMLGVSAFAMRRRRRRLAILALHRRRYSNVDIVSCGDELVFCSSGSGDCGAQPHAVVLRIDHPRCGRGDSIAAALGGHSTRARSSGA